MQCPACSSRLRQVKSRNVVVDICPTCSGIWFDSGELHLFLTELIQSKHIEPAQTVLYKPIEVLRPDPAGVSIKICPRCQITMNTFNYAYNSNVFVDKCPCCEGIWTDTHETKRLARYLKMDPQATLVGTDIIQNQQRLSDLDDWADMSRQLSGHAGFWMWYMPKIIVPIGDDLSKSKVPCVTLSIIALCVILFFSPFAGIDNRASFIDQWGFVPAQFWAPALLSSLFLHSSFYHLAGNMCFLWVFGYSVEERLGHWGFLILYLVGGVAAGLVHALFNLHSHVPMIGASGAVSAVMGAYMIFSPKARIRLFCICRIVPIPAWLYLSSWFVFQMFYSFLGFSYDAVYQIAWFAHIGGFVCGVTAAYLVKTVIQPAREQSAAKMPG